MKRFEGLFWKRTEDKVQPKEDHHRLSLPDCAQTSSMLCWLSSSGHRPDSTCLQSQGLNPAASSITVLFRFIVLSFLGFFFSLWPREQYRNRRHCTKVTCCWSLLWPCQQNSGVHHRTDWLNRKKTLVPAWCPNWNNIVSELPTKMRKNVCCDTEFWEIRPLWYHKGHGYLSESSEVFSTVCLPVVRMPCIFYKKMQTEG